MHATNQGVFFSKEFRMNQWGSDAFAGADLAGFGGNPSTVQGNVDARYGGGGPGVITVDELQGGWLVPAHGGNVAAERVPVGSGAEVGVVALSLCRVCLLTMWEQERRVRRSVGACKSVTAQGGVEAIVKEASERWQGGLEDAETMQCVKDLLEKRVMLAEVRLLNVMSGRSEQGQARNEPSSSRG
jgi:hypothetical protein